MLAACGDEGAAPGEGEASATGGDGAKTYAMVFKNTGNPYGEKMMDGFEEAINEAGGEVILRAPDQPTAEGQIQII
ncbi:rhamnose ABC transporter substrate-binding protein, partial [Bacillus sp. SIMBA_161]